MCGICGKFSYDGVSLKELKRMSDIIAHRGPDDEGFYIKGHMGLGHRRLSIIDLSLGKQPISNENKTIWISFNGEIYNYKELRKDLDRKGHIFSTNSDTEVIVHLYEEYGEKCVEKLGGMFAFAVWDENEQKLLIARDRIGHKPLFFLQNGTDFLFASEVKSILEAHGVPREINFEAIHHYLSLRFIPAPHTMIKGIKKLPAGHYLVYQNGKLKIEKYWDLSFREKINLTEDELIEGVGVKLREAVDSHLMSDVPIGAFLSGGMDTSTVVALMGTIMNQPFKTFSIGVKEQDFNELPYAKMVAERYKTEHIYEVVQANLIKLLPTMIWHLDEPSDPIAACMFQAAKLAAQHVKVVLGGDGGDELFAGFDRYLGVGLIDYYNYIPSLIREKVIGPLINSFPDSFTYKSTSQKLRWIHQLSSSNDGERYAEATAFFRFNHAQKHCLFGDSLWQQLKNNYSNNIIVDTYNNSNADDPIDKMLYTDFMTRLSEHTLMLTDRMNMAFSLEARSPFLDHPLVEYMARFPSSMKIKGRNLKYILRKFAKDYLPEEIIKRKKQGFMFPIAYWLRSELYDFSKDFLIHSFFVREGFFNKNEVLNLIEDHRKNKIDNHVRLWMLINLEIWYQLYFEGRSLADIQDKIQYDYKIAV
ncbi:MAG: asparagine synthase (glutamine-hydrolyzing) [Ignavibacteria bacterium]